MAVPEFVRMTAFAVMMENQAAALAALNDRL